MQFRKEILTANYEFVASLLQSTIQKIVIYTIYLMGLVLANHDSGLAN